MNNPLVRLAFPCVAFVAVVIVACTTVGPTDTGPVESPPTSLGPNPTLPEPEKQTIPIVQVAEARGWPGGAQPKAANGTQVNAFATGFVHPRWLYVLPNGDVLVAETNAPERPDEGKGIKGKVMKTMQKKAGAGVPSANRITLLRDADGDGVAEMRLPFLSGLMSPFGMALIDSTLYIANSDAIVSVPYVTGQTQITTPPVKLTGLPAGPLNHHWTKNIIASPDGSKLYASIA